MQHKNTTVVIVNTSMDESIWKSQYNHNSYVWDLIHADTDRCANILAQTIYHITIIAPRKKIIFQHFKSFKHCHQINDILWKYLEDFIMSIPSYIFTKEKKHVVKDFPHRISLNEQVKYIGYPNISHDTSRFIARFELLSESLCDKSINVLKCSFYVKSYRGRAVMWN